MSINSSRPRVRLTIPFWGKAYAEKMARITIPALLAPGNLPALAEDFDVEIALVTEESLFSFVERNSVFARLRQFATLMLKPVDDLMTGHPGDYGPVLTFALVRGFADLGEAMLDYYLLFLNADFILADGCYRTLAKLMKEGHQVIHSPSFRGVLEDVMPALMRKVQDGVLAVPPREMVALALANMHITVRARIVNQKGCHQWRMDQFYWYVDEQTLIGYQWPIALAALKPQRVITTPKLMFDYGFIPDICPTAEKYYISDSDDFFMLEPQQKASGNDLVRLGWISQEEIAADLAKWTTREQRECGQQLHVFHSNDLPSCLPEVAAESEAYMADLVALLPPPNSHDPHPLFAAWWSSVVARMASKTPLDGPPVPPRQQEKLFGGVVLRLVWRWFHPLVVAISEALGRLGRSIYHGIYGDMPFVSACHPLWIDLVPMTAAIRRHAMSSLRRLWVADYDGLLAAAIQPGDVVMSPAELTPSIFSPPLTPIEADVCFAEISIHRARSLSEIYSLLRTMVRHDGEVNILVQNFTNIPVDVADTCFCADALPAQDPFDVSFHHGSGLIHSLYWWLTRSYGSPTSRLVKIALLLIAALPWSLTVLARKKEALGSPAKPWSSMYIRTKVRKHAALMEKGHDHDRVRG